MRSNAWLERKVFHWAHRGGGREAPSNTLRAMHHAVTVGAHGLELDVHCTADVPPIVVVAHDDDLSTMAGDARHIHDLTLAQLQTVNAGENWVPGKIASVDPGDAHPCRAPGPVPADLRVPTVEEVLSTFAAMPLNLELKSRAVAEPLAQALARAGHDDVIVVSIRDWWLRPFRRSAPSVPTAAGGVALVAFFLASRIWLPLPYRRPVAVQVPWRLFGKRICDRRLIWAAHQRGMAVHVWTVDDPSIMRRAIDIGVDGIMTDTPTVLAAVLTDTGKGWHPPA